MMPKVKTMSIIEEKWLDRIVEMARATMQTGKVFGRLCKNHGWHEREKCPECDKKHQPILQRAQLSNLKNFADATDSVRALELFIRYQMGRKEKTGWEYRHGSGESFGDLVIRDFDTLGKWAEEIDPEDRKATHLWLIRLYTGFLSRWHVAMAGGEGEEAEDLKEG
ncbi:MAG: hypothetical protein HPY68_05130 [Candidatus Atribacteria bacterium]|nr:hypothetical protein [Candidatus Atribacteria bacterium]